MIKPAKFALSAIVAGSTLVQLSACTKIFDHFFGSDSSPKKCKILSFTQTNVPTPSGNRTEYFYYNTHGDIDSIVGDNETGSAGAHLFYFTYDSNHRLIAYREDAGESYPYQEFHTYAYENGRIVRDSVRVQPDGTSTDVKTLEYDIYGRVIKERRKIVSDDGSVFDNIEPLVFAYDDKGNLIFNSATYDNGVNFLGTNKYLMFTQRDYSKNNRIGATSYNDRKLPLGFAAGIQAVYGPSSLLSFGLPVQIVYSCN